MEIEPGPAGSSQPPVDPAALRGARTARNAPEPGSPPPAAAREPDRPNRRAADRVEVSGEARELAQQARADREETSLSSERLAGIGRRLAAGHYDQSEVIAELARRLLRHPDLHAE